ncbi:MAG: hypoxanthine phosphoribosyltransferase [Proteobacteria bacterium]|nr:hypoxanthine phosphoribosyltransferase [Pseudomonadota bacterium]
MVELKKVLSEENIKDRIERVAKQISSDYKDKNLVLIGILKGSFIFMADLMRHINIPLIADFMGASSYHQGTSPSETVKITKDITVDIKGKDVLVIEDIIDTGRTLSFLLNHLKSFEPASIKICTHIKKNERREIDIHIDYACHTIEKGFLVGYGLDYNEAYRNLPEIYHMKF